MSQILHSETPIECKQLAHEIVNFDEDNWKQVAKNMCKDGLLEKFRQNPSIKETLLNTGEKPLVECSYDKICTGVSLSNRNCLDRRLWINTGGILGEMLMDIRNTLRNDTSIKVNEGPELMEATAST